MNMLDTMKNKQGFIAALDQSGGSSPKTLKEYGIDSFNNEEEMFNLIHDMRLRIINSESFTNDKIIGVILFQDTINRKYNDKYISEYLLDKGILSFLKIDKGLDKENNNVCLMKDINNLDNILDLAKKHNVFGTKMRSLINEYNEIGIKDIVKQQFFYAEKISKYNLIPIIEPEVNINSKTKYKCEELLKSEILKYLDEIDYKVMFKFSLPDVDNFYKEIINHKNVVRVVALSGGYSKKVACLKLSNNNGMIASFSRGLLEGLKVSDTKEEFDSKLSISIDEIYNASKK